MTKMSTILFTHFRTPPYKVFFTCQEI